jgi:hypothetical protein
VIDCAAMDANVTLRRLPWNQLGAAIVDDAPRWVSATKVPLGDDCPVAPATDR